jgi:hypothetical protein
MKRLYILPVIETIIGEITYRSPAYFGGRFISGDSELFGVSEAVMYYGRENVCMVGADVTTEQHNQLSAYVDVLAIPENLDNNLSPAAVSKAQSTLEDMNIPANWINSSYTFRQVLRIVGGLFQFAQRVKGLTKEKIFDLGIPMSRKWKDLPLGMKQRLSDAADSMGYDKSDITANSTVRQVLKNLADQWGGRKLLIGGIEI